ncbi:MAG: DsbA family protein [Phycisphaerae bacterium]
MSTRAKPARAAAARAPHPPTAVRVGGLLALAVAAISSLLLVLEHLGGMKLPGCGVGSACAAATASFWGKVPGIGWPVSHLGFAYFAAMLMATARAGVTTELHRIARGGALVSLFYLGVILVEQLLCPYCLAAHVANLAFAAIVEFAARKRTVTRGGAALAISGFAAMTVVLALVEVSNRAAARERAERNLAESTSKLLQAASRPTTPTVPPTSKASSTASPQSTSTSSQPTPPPRPTRLFTGRYRHGPAQAAIRVVVFSDYQCKACKQVETELRALLSERGDMSLSAKQFPMMTGCNPHVPRTMHNNACWAARAAEAAGILRGGDGFWKMHFALFDRGGSFTQAELRQMVAGMGYDAAEFERTMTSPETLRRVRADCDEAMELGMRQTPMVFINGVEFRGWEAPNGIRRAVEALAASNPPALTAEADRPAGAVEKLVEDWRIQPRRAIADTARRFTLGPDDAPIRVTIAADYSVVGFATLDEHIRAAVARRGDILYRVIHYPANQQCNAAINRVINASACWSANIVEAAGIIGGDAARWAMHHAVLANQGCVSDADISWLATLTGIDSTALLAASRDPAVAAAVRADAELLRAFSIASLPTLFVNDRRVPAWEHKGYMLLEEIFYAAAAE